MTITLFLASLLLGVPLGIIWAKITLAKDLTYHHLWHPELYR